MHPVKPRFVCWRCHTSYDADMKFCGNCGADMHRASRLDQEAAGVHDDDDRARAETLLAGRRQSDDDPWIGRLIDNRYRIREVLGHGGMGVVYRVEHQRMGKIAALKLLHPELAREPEVQARFHREAEAVSRLTHHNTVQVFDFGAYQGALYLVMEYVPGIDVGRIIDRDGALSFGVAAPLLAQICASLMEAHELGVIHRDLKPENIVVSRTHRGRDFVKVLDFGLAKLSEREELSGVTGRGAVVGTPYYMSPEQIRGDDIDARSDLYALGALMYKVLTGDPPFEANTPVGVLTKHLTDPVVPPSRHRPELDIDPRVDAMVLKALQKDARDRYGSAAELAEVIESLYATLDDADHVSRRLYVGSGPVRTEGAEGRRSPSSLGDELEFDGDRLRRSDIDVFERRLKRRRLVRVVAVPLLLAGLAGGGLYARHWLRDRPRTSESEPNDEPGEATLIAAGSQVTGRIGKRLADDQGDRDFYVLSNRVATDGSMTLTAHLTSQRNLDMDMELVDASGTALVRANSGGKAADEWLRRVRIRAPVRLLVAEVPGDGLPTESISDRYQLSVDIAPVDPRLETEPNDLGSDANPVVAGRGMTAHFDGASDVDVYRFEGAVGLYRVSVSGAQVVALTVNGETATPARPLRLEAGSLLEARPGDGAVAWDAPYTLELSSAK